MARARDIGQDGWRAVDQAVLCFVRDRIDGRVLLIHKKTGLGTGLINAPGGRIEPGESPYDAAVRETREEVGIEVSDLVHLGDLYFQFLDGYSIRGYVFVTDRWSGDARSTDEADPFWCMESEIPYHRMWSDDRWWLPQLLAGREFQGRFIFADQKMLSMSLDIESSDVDRRNSGIGHPEVP